MTATTNSSLLKFTNILAFVLTVLVNGLAGSTTILGGKNTAMISDSYPTRVTPAGYVFSIWGVIYVLLGVFVVYQALPSQQGKGFQRRMSWLFVLSSVANIVWLFLWQFEYLALSVLVMFLLLATLILIYLRLDIGKSAVEIRERLAVRLPFSVYLGWITIATIADVSVTLVSIKWGGFGISPETWATLIIVVALLITILLLVTRADVGYALVIIWALVGIAMNQSGHQVIVMLAGASAVIVAVALVPTVLVTWLKRR
jgi:hypothetical protein